MNKSNIRKAIKILENVKPQEIVKRSVFRSEDNKYCLNGLIVEKSYGYRNIGEVEYVVGWLDRFFGDDTVARKLTEYHNNYAWGFMDKELKDKAWSYDKMMKNALTYLRGLLK